MPDQPIPDFSQNSQFAPGFVPQAPIPGISSSMQPQFQPQFNNSYMIAQQADQIAVQSVTNARTTMALAQQNLMYSMHNALLGGMTAFSDVSRRGGAMITAMAPAGRYNDFLAPNQNWALESSFRREMGFGLANMAGLDPYNSPLSRVIQGRRPEFLTEGEYSSTMGYAHAMRMDNLLKVGKQVGTNVALSLGASALGLGMTGMIGIPLVGGLLADRAFEAQHAEREETLRRDIDVKNKRVGIGQQYISTGEMDKVTGTFYRNDNPYAARFFGDNFLGNAFKPDVQKLKMFDQMKDNGLLAFENLDADSLIKQITKISDTVEKFSRIGKVTREASIKMMGELKGAGINGPELIADFKHAAITSSMTGIDMQTMVGMKAQAARQGSYQGFDTYSASASFENTLSGFAMMQSNGLFKQKDIMRMTQAVHDNNTQGGPTDVIDGILRFGSLDKYKEFLRGLGGGSAAVGQINMSLINFPVLNKVNTAVDQAVASKKYKDWDALVASPMAQAVGLNKDHPELVMAGYAHYMGWDDISPADQARNQMRLNGQEPSSVSILDVDHLGSVNGVAHQLFNSEFINNYKANRQRNSHLDQVRNPTLEKVKRIFSAKYGEKGSLTTEDAADIQTILQQNLPIDRNGRLPSDVEAVLANSIHGDRRFVGMDLLAASTKSGVVETLLNRSLAEEYAVSPLGGVLSAFNRAGVIGSNSNPKAKAIADNIRGLGAGKLNDFTGVINNIWNKGYANLTLSDEVQQQFIGDVKGQLLSAGIDPKLLTGLDHRNLFLRGKDKVTGEGGAGQQEVFASLLGIMAGEHYNSALSSTSIVKSIADSMGMNVSQFTKTLDTLKPWAKTFTDSQGNIKEEFLNENKQVKPEARQALKTTVENLEKTTAGRVYVEKMLGGKEKVSHMMEALSSPTAALSNEGYNQWSKKLDTLNMQMDQATIDQWNKTAQEAADPAGTAINTMNEILKQVLHAMGGDKNSPVPKPQDHPNLTKSVTGPATAHRE